MAIKQLLSTLAVGLAVSCTGVAAQAVETPDFNVSQALLEKGIDIAALPGLAEYAVTAHEGSLERRDTSVGCAIACNSLQRLYGVTNTLLRGATGFSDFTGSYWSDDQAQVSPACVFKPTTALEVSVIVLLARLTQCPFAAKSGGHAAFAGASSIQDGITISFANLKRVSLSADKKVASIQPGNTWGPVFEQLTKSDVTVVGGRLYNIGVGGLTLGGGISYWSNKYGWACDNVESFDVVTANGALVQASAATNKDLYWALRGGGNNFGLVVNFNLYTIPLPGGHMFGGSRVYTEDKFAAVEAATSKMLANPDPEAGLYVVYYYSNGTKLAIPAFYHENPNAANATVFADFNAIQAISDTTKPRVLADWGRETMNDSPPGLREMYYTISTAASPEIIQVARDIYFREVVAVSGIPGLIPNLVIQGITSLQLKQMQKYGGNALGLNPIRGGDGKPCYIMLMAAMWSHASDDEVVHAFMSDVMTKITAEARARGLGSRYQYMNYASQYQDVVKGYGCTNKARLSAIARKYDPQGVFQVLQPGGFKLDRAPLPDSRYFST